jgi:hypothetical protein
MNRIVKISSVAAAVLAATLSAPTVAWADGGRHYSDRGTDGHRQYNHHYDRHDRYKGYYKSYPRGYGGHHNHHNDDDGKELLIGLLLGGVVGYAMGNQQSGYDYGASAYPPAVAAPRVEAYPAPQYSYGPADSTCLQEREYQSKVIVGGKQVDAYGTACLQPDGSWRRGPAQLVSY